MRRTGAAGAALAAVGAGVGWAVRDYRSWKALGPAGVPANPAGWLRVRAVGLRARDPHTWREPGTGDVSRVLLDLPPRPGTRPEVSPYPVPNRVLTQHAPQPLVAALREAVEGLAQRADLEIRTSGRETSPLALCRRGGPELAHVHPADGSMHVVLGPLDARVVVARRWGEFHPLAGVRCGPGGRVRPTGYVLLYPPRDQDEVVRLRTIVEAAIGPATATGRPGPA